MGKINLTYIIGGRKTGKTTRLITIQRISGALIVVPTHPMVRSFEKQLYLGNEICSVMELDNFLWKFPKQILCDEFQMFPQDYQQEILAYSAHTEVICTINPILIIEDNPPPFWRWKHWANIEKHKVNEQMAKELQHQLQPERFVTEILGKFILE